MQLPTVAQLAGIIDHTVLRPEATRAELDAELEFATSARVFSLCLRPSDLRYAVQRLSGSGVQLTSAIGFPHGTAATGAKATEAAWAADDGAIELDMVLNIGWLRSGMIAEAEADIQAVVAAVPGIPVKVIMEAAYLNPIQLDMACRAAERAGARFVKTSTGFGGGGANLDDVRVMRAATSQAVQVEPSGGIRDLDTILAMVEAGATRFSTSATKSILDDLEQRLLTGQPASSPVPRGRHSY